MIDGGLGAKFRENLLGIHFQRIETGGTGRGICDSNYAAQGGIEGWIEFKQTDGWTCDLRPEQQGWILRRARLGCRVWIAVRQKRAEGPRAERRDGLWLAHGGLAAQLAANGLRSLPESLSEREWWHWPGPGPARWAWDEIREILTQ